MTYQQKELEEGKKYIECHLPSQWNLADQDLANDLSAKTMLFEHFIKAKVGSISWHAQY